MSQALELLRELKAQALVTDLDLHFATLIGRLAADQRPELLLAAAFTSFRTGAGDVCLQLAEWSGRTVGGTQGQIRLPACAEWMRLLLQTPVVGSPGDYRPLILDTAGRLYLQRYWVYEQQLADLLLARSRAEVAAVDPERLRQGLGQLFPPQPALATDWQKVAAAVAVQKRFCVISGGPGTGKTSTVVRILALLQQQAGGRPLVIALAAPTGKAAARLQESIQQARAHLPAAPELDAIPAQAMTLHRLMGSRQDSVQFRHDADNPLPVDVLVIDEASMVDVALMSKVVAALPAEARLILLGDRNQLASVEAGAVLGDICGDDPGFSADFQQRLAHLTDQVLAAETAAHQPLADAVVQLRHSYRFGGHSGIGRLAEAVNRGDGESARQLLEREELADIRLLAGSSDPLAIAASAYRHYLKRIAEGAAAAEVFAAFDSFRVLCALRSGPAGVAELNQQIRQRLETAGLVAHGVAWYPGRPVLITRNDHNLKLYNGDVGILLPGEAEEMQVCFQTSDGVRRVSPARLPPHETAFAMTVHKSQGSEFARVLLILPGRDSPLLTRELIYTGLTRSRREFILSDAHGLLVPAIARRTRRTSGLREKLWG
jgi:exodeoxyribonuclease V alpha subunit